MKASEAYMMHVALRAHFIGDYDYFKYHGRANTSKVKREYNERIYKCLVNTVPHAEIETLLVLHMLEDPHQWIGTIVSSGKWRKQKKKLLRLHEIYKDDLKTIIEFCTVHNMKLKDVFLGDSQYPIVMKLCQQGYIELETLVILNRITGFMDVASNKFKDDIIFEPFTKKVAKYNPFLRINMKRYEVTTMKIFEDAKNEYNI